MENIWKNIDNARDNFIAHIVWHVQQSSPFIFGNKAEQTENQSMLIKEVCNLTMSFNLRKNISSYT